MTNQNFSQRNKSFRKLFLKSNITFSNNPINRLIGVQPENDKKILLKKLKDKISTISECKLKNNSNNIVFNDGNINSPIMLIGEAPGQKEDELSKPFVGEAGSLLNKMLSAINLNRKDLYITNVVNYRPPLNRKPDSNEIKRYSEFLLEHVYIIKPKIIILLGSTAMEAFFGSNLKISKERGIWKEMLIKDKTFLTMVTFHPAYLLRQNDQKKYSWIDLKNIRNKIDELKIGI
jgi:DNA polymerase|tara:strand:- start:1359 stop:2057 length:699 start_codon:yes stop_codon:yes gene_type:complete